MKDKGGGSTRQESLLTETRPNICRREERGKKGAWEGSISDCGACSERVSQAHGAVLGQSHLLGAPHLVALGQHQHCPLAPRSVTG